MSRLFLVFLVLCSIGNYGVQSSASSPEIFDRNKLFETNQKDTATHVYRESIRRLESRTDIVKVQEMPSNYTHELVFAIQQLNMDKLLLVLEDISNPASENYGNHMSAASVAALTANPTAASAAIAYLNENGATVVSESLYGEYVTAIAPVAVWNKVLQTKFYAFQQTQIDGSIEKLVRSEHYHVPIELDEHILCVLNTIQMPLRTSSVKRIPYTPQAVSKIDLANSHFESQGAPTGYIYPDLLRRFYKAENAFGSSVATQAVFGGNEDCFSPRSLRFFQRNLTREAEQPALTIDDDFVTDDYRCDSGEGNLDIQYIISMARGSPTTWWHRSGGLAGWLVEVASTPTPPLVLSISYGADELSVSRFEFELFDQQAQKLGVRGTTVLVASGDDGVHSSRARSSAAYCGYNPDFPSGSPYVVAVGATSGPESGTPEVVCQSDTGNAITSGGGFSTYYPRPKWQDTQVAGYFAAIAKSGELPETGYNAKGRGFPDISLAGVNYLVHGPDRDSIDGGTVGMAGTSASCPVLAGMLSSVNAARMAKGNSPVGWVTPAFYAANVDYINDITVGNNKAAIGRVCPQGFYAAPGWDPTSGLGSVNYAKMETYFLSLGGVSPPTAFPTNKPSVKPQAPTIEPTKAPTREPTKAPTREPTSTAKPTTKPVAATPAPVTTKPTLLPSVAPTLKPNTSPSNVPSLLPISTSSPSPPLPTSAPSSEPTLQPIPSPSTKPSGAPSVSPSSIPSALPSIASPSAMPTSAPSVQSSVAPSFAAIEVNTPSPTASAPTASSTETPSAAPTSVPSSPQLIITSSAPTESPTLTPIADTSKAPSRPTPSRRTKKPTRRPATRPTKRPTKAPTPAPSKEPATLRPTYSYRLEMPTYVPGSMMRTYRPTVATSHLSAVSPLFPATIKMHQDLDGITYEEVSTFSFRAAIAKSVEDVIGFNGTTVTTLVVNEGNSGRKLLSTVSVTYTISLISRLTSQEVYKELQSSIDSGMFLSLLRLNSGYALGKPTATSLILSVPSVEPTQAPTGSPQVSTGLSTVFLAAIIIGAIAGCILLIFGAITYGCHRNKDKKKRFPAVHTQMDSDGVDSIPDNIFDIIPECVAGENPTATANRGTVTQRQLLADSVLEV